MGLVIRKIGFESAKRKVIEQIQAKKVELGRMLQRCAEDLCTHARLNGAYTDRTHNLRSSIGARVYYRGEVIFEGGFEQVGNGDHGILAAGDALSAFESKADISADGFTVVLVAGENYARYVESYGFNVLHLTESEMFARLAEIKHDVLGGKE